MINPNCNRCGDELHVTGALLFSPPVTIEATGVKAVKKYHLCVVCFDWIEALLKR